MWSDVTTPATHGLNPWWNEQRVTLDMWEVVEDYIFGKGLAHLLRLKQLVDADVAQLGQKNPETVLVMR